jgi:purine-cytosine permease-like protein
MLVGTRMQVSAAFWRWSCFHLSLNLFGAAGVIDRCKQLSEHLLYIVSMQVMARWTARVPQWIWTFLGTLAHIAVAIPGYSHFESALVNFMLIIIRLIPLPIVNSLIFRGVQVYWLAIYEGIAITDYILFKKGMKGYDPSIYASPKFLSLGAAALSAFGVGVAGAILGMTQVWFVGRFASELVEHLMEILGLRWDLDLRRYHISCLETSN